MKRAIPLLALPLLASGLTLGLACGSSQPATGSTTSTTTTGAGGATTTSTTSTTVTTGAGGAGGQGDTTTTTTATTGSGGAGGTGGSGGQPGTGGAGGQMPPPPMELCINELMPLNMSTIVDEKGAYGDWIELHNPTDSAIDLSGWSITDDLLIPAKNPFPMGLSIPKHGFLLLWADEKVPLGPKHLGFKLSASGGAVGLYGPNGESNIISYGDTAADIAYARKPDCCPTAACVQKEMHGTPGESNLTVPQVDEIVLAAGSSYRYQDQNQPPPAAWTMAAFDDSAWPSGPGPLGYGDAHIVTTVGYGPDGNNKYITTWFRGTFNAAGAATFTKGTLELLRDDGALVLLNGVEIARSNLPAGALDKSTLAPAAASGADETTYFSYDIDPSLFVEGKNVLAVEVHQSSAGSSDLGFDAKITVKKPAP
ncbi:MAG: lamin tail domain-containing protein [Byssovorax sp.]